VSEAKGVANFRCAACAAAHGRLVLEKEGLQLWRCASCALVQRHPMPSVEEVRAMYASDGHYGDECMGQLEAFLERDRTVVHDLLARGGPGPLLDVGCGAGILLRAAQEAGLLVTGLELSGPSAERAREALGVAVHETEIEHAPLEDGSLGIVTFSHSLEHVREPTAALRRARALLAPGGLVHIAVPNWKAAKRNVVGARVKWIYPHHLTYFDEASLRAALEAAGLRPVHVESRPFLGDDWHFVLALVRTLRCEGLWKRFLRMGERPLEELVGDDVQIGAAPWRFRLVLRISRAILWLWPERLLASIGRGEELRVTARRPREQA